MFSKLFFLSTFTGLALSIPTPFDKLSSANSGTPRFNGPYYTGPAESFPSKDTWTDFTTLFNDHKNDMFATGDTASDIEYMQNAIIGAAQDIGVDRWVIICIIMMESTGNVGVENGDGGRSKGLMQAWESTSYRGQHGLSQNQISGMVNAGTTHYKGNLKEENDADTATTIYKALRRYNSGSIDYGNLSDGLGATDYYVSDIANCLQGQPFKPGH